MVKKKGKAIVWVPEATINGFGDKENLNIGEKEAYNRLETQGRL